MRFFIPTLLLTFILNSAFGLTLQDRENIYQSIKGYVHAWNEQAGKGFADDFTEDADFINIFGMHFVGKQEIEKRHQEILQGFLKDSKFFIKTLTIREIKPGVALAIVDWKVTGFPNMQSKAPQAKTDREGVFSHVFVEDRGRWFITATQNTLIPLK